ncbi:hypothetical protein L249_0330 [Ophiocordyceps polyrhachis-furcata BCC 54312]|uniref:Uncharacterized protein n=1 Tax=Ophiocordyceps polyrhachis-furcata BCC 54312 TaxID=1330021 RepID=A0A367LDR2_9HYPO|nr:hypothetical protein L249_0330 [Ophiocordyceps polyrhachis-furcata BCC 54312]
MPSTPWPLLLHLPVGDKPRPKLETDLASYFRIAVSSFDDLACTARGPLFCDPYLKRKLDTELKP